MTLDEYTHWLTLVDHLKVKAFIEITVAHTIRDGMLQMIRMSGLGAMKPNTIVLGFYDEESPKDFFESTDSQYRTSIFSDVETSEGRQLFELRSVNSGKKLDATQFVGMIADILKLKKNVCVCRHFHNLEKSAISKQFTPVCCTGCLERKSHCCCLSILVSGGTHYVDRFSEYDCSD